MSKKILIDGIHPKNVRIAVTSQGELKNLDFELSNKKSLRGNIYLAKITKVENSLQAAFVDYGEEKNGFLPFSEIHPDYYQIPNEEKEKLLKEMEVTSLSGEGGYDTIDLDSDSEKDLSIKDYKDDLHNPQIKEASDEEEVFIGSFKGEKGRMPNRKYRISEVIRRDQLVLVQVIKEERGNKGATVSSFISLAGRFFVYMPNSRSKNGISRKINHILERKRIKELMRKINNLKTESLVARTAANGIKDEDLEADCKFLKKQWQEIKSKTFSSTAPSLIYEEDDILKRSVRDYYDKEVVEIIVEGEDSYSKLSKFVSESAYKKSVKVSYYDYKIPIFTKFGIEDTITQLQSPFVKLPGGGYIVIEQTEALTSIDVNSGKGTSEANIEETALKTNLEAAEEIARQLPLRGISGLIVVDFIDMLKLANRKLVEREFKNHLMTDRARIQINRISIFGLLEISRQRTRPSIVELTSVPCIRCDGTGFTKSLEYTTMNVLRTIDGFSLEKVAKNEEFNCIDVFLTRELAIYLLNQKKSSLQALEKKFNASIFITAISEGDNSKFKITFKMKNAHDVTEVPEDLGLDIGNTDLESLRKFFKKKSFWRKILTKLKLAK
jgi:ribonuclease E